MTYSEAVKFLYSLGNEIKTAKYDLDRITVLLDRLGSPHRRGRFIHIAGTNGKGSTSGITEAGLRQAGYRTGLYTSPHLDQPTERIRLNGVPLSQEEFASAFATVEAEAKHLDPHPTYFEMVTAMAFVAFAGSVDVIVLEVGLGGRLDATNVVLPELCVITPIDFDHEAFLGSSIEAIAGEKAGILKPGVPAVFAPQRPEVQQVLERYTHSLPLPEIQDLRVHKRGSRFRALGVEMACPLPGLHQVDNARTAIAALSAFGVPVPAIRDGLASVQWPGRLEFVSEEPEIILDGAHNPAGARALASYVRQFYGAGEIRLIYGAMRDKSVQEIIEILFPLFAEVIVTAPQQSRAIDPAVLLDLADHPNVHLAQDLPSALALPSQLPTFITGSLFLVAEARRLLVSE